MTLNDAQIRPELTSFLQRRQKKSNAIIEELPINFGEAIADVVTISKYLHCYEIKGETDCIQRIQKQGQFYNTCFKKITLVTTQNHLSYALQKAPFFWGIMVVKFQQGRKKICFIRAAKDNPEFSIEDALHTLWKDELHEISKENNVQVKESMNKKVISKILAEKLSKSCLTESISRQVYSRLGL